MHEDAERMAKRFHEVWQALTPSGQVIPNESWEDADSRWKAQLVRTFDEMLRSELVFGGPSLYSEPAV